LGRIRHGSPCCGRQQALDERSASLTAKIARQAPSIALVFALRRRSTAVVQLIRNEQVAGSNPVVGSVSPAFRLAPRRCFELVASAYGKYASAPALLH
jgi:hypothetical protein